MRLGFPTGALLLACWACAPEVTPAPQRFTARPAEFVHIRGDGQPWEPLAVQKTDEHYWERIALRRLPTEEELAGPEQRRRVPGIEDEEAFYWSFRVERRVDFGPSGPAAVSSNANATRDRLMRNCAVVKWQLLYRTPEDGLYEWTHDGCGPGGRPEHEILRLLSGSEGVHRASLRARGRRIPEEMRTEWIKILSEARLAGGG